MSRKRLATKVRLVYGVGHRVQLRTGHDFFRSGFGPWRDTNGKEIAAVIREMRRAWPELRAVVMETDRYHFGLFHRPWGWWKFEAKMADPPRDANEQKKYLLEHDLLTAEEKSALL